jgi:hypothetical protein
MTRLQLPPPAEHFSIPEELAFAEQIRWIWYAGPVSIRKGDSGIWYIERTISVMGWIRESCAWPVPRP